jgi:hypothetical protein
MLAKQEVAERLCFVPIRRLTNDVARRTPKSDRGYHVLADAKPDHGIVHSKGLSGRRCRDVIPRFAQPKLTKREGLVA